MDYIALVSYCLYITAIPRMYGANVPRFASLFFEKSIFP